MSLPPPSPERIALVTGASSGIGAEIARRLAWRGHGVVLLARRRDALEALAAELSGPVRAEVVVADLRDAVSRRQALERIGELGLGVDILVNNAGVATTGPVAAGDADAEVGMLRTDVEAVADLCSRVVPEMVAARRGAVLNVASTAAFQPLPGQAGYAAAKAFVLSYTQALAAEVAPFGVTVSALCPGPVRTGLLAASGMSEEDAASALPGLLWEPVTKVAEEAVRGLERGIGVIIPGRANQIGALAGYLTPRRLLLPLVVRRHPALRR